MTAAEWERIRAPMMDLVSNMIMHPEDGMEWFVLWCRQHLATIETVALTG